MRFIINIAIFLALIGFCFYWFNDGNSNRNDPSKIPYIGGIFGAVSEKYAQVRFYLDSGQGNFWDYLENAEEVRQITDKFKKIYETGKPQYQP
jgi:hypothetical protein